MARWFWPDRWCVHEREVNVSGPSRRNLTDRNPPPLPSGHDGVYRYNLRPGFDGFVHDIKGRTLFARFRWRTGR